MNIPNRLGVSLQTKLILLVCGLVAVLAIAFAVLLSSRVESQVTSGLHRRASELAAVLSSATSQGLEFEDAEGSTALLATLQTSPDVAYAVLRKEDGSDLATLNRDKLPKLELQAKETIEVVEAGGFLNAVAKVKTRMGRNGTLVIGFKLDEFHAARRANYLWALGVSAVMLVFGMLVSIFGARVLVRPIQELTRITQGIVSTGDLTQNIQISSRDEIGALAQVFQQMVEKLRTIPVKLNESVTGLTQAVEALNDMMGVQTRSVQRQAASLAEAETTVAEIRQTSGLASEKAQRVLEVAERAEVFVASGQKAIDTSINGMSAIGAQVEMMITSINGLSAQTNQIEQIIGSVKDLADQSNMLALNAAIEATRAGEFGKGFAVVAREIRSLANQSIKNTAVVRDILKNIREAIQSTAVMSQSGGERITRSMEEIRQSGESFREITGVLMTSTEAARQIAVAVGQQNAGVVQVTTTITELNGAMQESLKGIESVEGSVKRLRGASSQLSNVMGSFKT